MFIEIANPSAHFSQLSFNKPRTKWQASWENHGGYGTGTSETGKRQLVNVKIICWSLSHWYSWRFVHLRSRYGKSQSLDDGTDHSFNIGSTPTVWNVLPKIIGFEDKSGQFSPTVELRKCFMRKFSMFPASASPWFKMILSLDHCFRPERLDANHSSQLPTAGTAPLLRLG